MRQVEGTDPAPNQVDQTPVRRSRAGGLLGRTFIITLVLVSLTSVWSSKSANSRPQAGTDGTGQYARAVRSPAEPGWPLALHLKDVYNAYLTVASRSL